MSLRVISQSKEPESDNNTFKVILLATLGIGSSLSTFYFLNQFLITAGVQYIWGSILSGWFLLVITILYVFFIKSLAKVNLIIFLQSIAPLAFFYNRLYPQPNLFLVGGAVVFFILSMAGASQGSKFLHNSLKISFWLTTRNILPKTVTGLLIFSSVIFYFNYFEWGKFNDELGQKLVDQTLITAEPLIKLQLGNVSFNQTLDGFLKVVSESQLKKIKLSAGPSETPKDFSSLSPELKTKAVAAASQQLKTALEKSFGPLDSRAEVRVVMFQLLKNYIGGLSANAKSLLNIGAAVTFYFTLKGIVFLFYWLLMFSAFVVFKFLLVIGFAYVSLETRSREFIMLT